MSPYIPVHALLIVVKKKIYKLQVYHLSTHTPIEKSILHNQKSMGELVCKMATRGHCKYDLYKNLVGFIHSLSVHLQFSSGLACLHQIWHWRHWKWMSAEYFNISLTNVSCCNKSHLIAVWHFLPYIKTEESGDFCCHPTHVFSNVLHFEKGNSNICFWKEYFDWLSF